MGNICLASEEHDVLSRTKHAVSHGMCLDKDHPLNPINSDSTGDCGSRVSSVPCAAQVSFAFAYRGASEPLLAQLKRSVDWVDCIGAVSGGVVSAEVGAWQQRYWLSRSRAQL